MNITVEYVDTFPSIVNELELDPVLYPEERKLDDEGLEEKEREEIGINEGEEEGGRVDLGSRKRGGEETKEDAGLQIQVESLEGAMRGKGNRERPLPPLPRLLYPQL